MTRFKLIALLLICFVSACASPSKPPAPMPPATPSPLRLPQLDRLPQEVLEPSFVDRLSSWLEKQLGPTPSESR